VRVGKSQSRSTGWGGTQGMILGSGKMVTGIPRFASVVADIPSVVKSPRCA